MRGTARRRRCRQDRASLDTRGGKLVKEIAGNDQPVIALGLSGNGSQAVIGLANKVVRICSVDDGKEIRKVGPLPASITALCFRNDAGQLAVGGDDKVIRSLAAGDGKTVKSSRVTAIASRRWRSRRKTVIRFSQVRQTRRRGSGT